jgi:hypothetical protein
MSEKCYTCFSTNKGLSCVEGNVDTVIKEFMSPDKDLGWTYYIYQAQWNCFNKNNKTDVARFLSSHHKTSDTHIDYYKID